MNKVYEIVTEKILAQLEKGNVPWRRPWRMNEQSCANLISKKEYNGINRLLTSIAMFEAGYNSPYFVTFKQAGQLGGHVKKSEHGTLVVFWKLWEHEKSDTAGNKEIKTIPILRYYLIFNVEQCEEIDPKKIPTLQAAAAGAD